MRPFSRDKEAAKAVHVDDVPFETLRRAPRNARKSRTSADTDFDHGAPLDPADASRTRARRRLIGAVAIALAAIVFVPMLFDRTPVAPSDDISLQIPDRDTPFEGRRGVPDASKGPLRPSSDVPQVAPIAPPVAAVEPTPAPPPSDATIATAEPRSTLPVEKVDGAATKASGPSPDGTPVTAIQKMAEKPADKGAEKAAEKSPAKPPEKPTDRSKAPSGTAASDDPRAVAALEGKAEPAAPMTAGDRSYAVQVAAYSAADKARNMRDQLVANGMKSYTESVSTAQGLRIRVRLGPYPSRDAADRARQKLKTIKLDGSVVPL